MCIPFRLLKICCCRSLSHMCKIFFTWTFYIARNIWICKILAQHTKIMNNANFITLHSNQNVFAPTARTHLQCSLESVHCLRVSACRDVTINNVQTGQLCFWDAECRVDCFAHTKYTFIISWVTLTWLCVCAWTDRKIYKGPKIFTSTIYIVFF